MLNINTNVFGVEIAKEIESFTERYIIKISSEIWENLIYNVLKRMRLQPIWTPGSHSPGSDITYNSGSISVKTGEFKGKSKVVSISSFRLTQFNTLDEKLIYIDGDGKNYDFYLCCIRDKDEYIVSYLDANAFKARDFVWKEEVGIRGRYKNQIKGWSAEKDDIKLKIVKCMSDQLWIDIPYRYFTEIKRVKSCSKM